MQINYQGEGTSILLMLELLPAVPSVSASSGAEAGQDFFTNPYE